MQKQWPALAIIILVTFPVGITAQQAGGEVVTVASSNLSAPLLADTLGGVKATSDIKRFSGDNLKELVGDKATVYQEYVVLSAASRNYGSYRVDVFEARSRFAAFGLFTFSIEDSKGIAGKDQLESGVAWADRTLLVLRDHYVVRAEAADSTVRARPAVLEALAFEAADSIKTTSVSRPPLLDSLPADAVPLSVRYFLGPQSLDFYVAHGQEMFGFAGDAEAVVAEYSNMTPQDVPVVGQSEHKNLKLIIVEYHTPQFATDAMARITDYVSSLPQVEQQRIIVKRTGNYIVEAASVRDREFAEGLVNSVQYPYTVKWLRNPLWPTNDPFRTQKAAQMLLSTFGLLGLILMTVLVVGSVLGTTIFLKRRKQQRKVFTDAGGMLRLELDPFESVILGLPPKRSEE